MFISFFPLHLRIYPKKEMDEFYVDLTGSLDDFIEKLSRLSSLYKPVTRIESGTKYYYDGQEPQKSVTNRKGDFCILSYSDIRNPESITAQKILEILTTDPFSLYSVLNGYFSFCALIGDKMYFGKSIENSPCLLYRDGSVSTTKLVQDENFEYGSVNPGIYVTELGARDEKDEKSVYSVILPEFSTELILKDQEKRLDKLLTEEFSKFSPGSLFLTDSVASKAMNKYIKRGKSDIHLFSFSESKSDEKIVQIPFDSKRAFDMIPEIVKRYKIADFYTIKEYIAFSLLFEFLSTFGEKIVALEYGIKEVMRYTTENLDGKSLKNFVNGDDLHLLARSYGIKLLFPFLNRKITELSLSFSKGDKEEFNEIPILENLFPLSKKGESPFDSLDDLISEQISDAIFNPKFGTKQEMYCYLIYDRFFNNR